MLVLLLRGRVRMRLLLLPSVATSSGRAEPVMVSTPAVSTPCCVAPRVGSAQAFDSTRPAWCE
eukprot:scaffold44393_cov42-Phaeocystis_antarctica.AAC.2